MKVRAPATQNVDVNNFNFDYSVLVNLSDDFGTKRMWRLDVEAARSLFKYRENFRKYQATQAAVKKAAQQLDLRGAV